MFENPRRGRQAKNLTTNVSKILDLKLSSEQIFFPKIVVGCPCGFHLIVQVVRPSGRLSSPFDDCMENGTYWHSFPGRSIRCQIND